MVTLRSEPLTPRRIVTTSRTRRYVTAQDRSAVTEVTVYQSHGRTFMASYCLSACVTIHFLGERSFPCTCFTCENEPTCPDRGT